MARTKAKKAAPKKAAPKKAAKTAAKKAPKKAAKKAAKAPKKGKVSAIPKGYTAVSAVMNQDDARATIAFCKEVFGAKPRAEMPGPNGKLMHAEIVIGDSVIMLSDAVMEPARVCSCFVYVPNVDKTYEKAIAAGAKSIMPPADQFWGDRFGRFVDPFGNLWGVATHFEDVTPAQMKKRMAAASREMA